MKRSNRGATFTEILIAAVLFAFSVLAVLSLFLLSIYISKKVDSEYAALNIARNRLESLKVEEFTYLTQVQEDKQRVDSTGVSDETGQFLRTTTVEMGYGGDSNIAKIEVEVSYYIRGTESTTPVKITTLFVNMD